MKKYIIAIIMLFAVIAASGCINQGQNASGTVINESRNVGTFNQIDLNGAGELIITQGNKESVTIEAPDNYMSNIKTSISNNKLSIGFTNNMLMTSQSIKIYVTVKDINSINVSGAGKINAQNLNANSLIININGAADSVLNNLNAQILNTTISGAGRMTVSGNVNQQSVQIMGAGEYNANNLQSKIASININGGGKATVKVSDTLNAIINGAGQISYIGSPKITQQINGAGQIKQIPG